MQKIYLTDDTKRGCTSETTLSTIKSALFFIVMALSFCALLVFIILIYVHSNSTLTTLSLLKRQCISDLFLHYLAPDVYDTKCLGYHTNIAFEASRNPSVASLLFSTLVIGRLPEKAVKSTMSLWCNGAVNGSTLRSSIFRTFWGCSK